MTTESAAEKSAVNGIRTALGIGGVLSVIVGILILAWPGKTAMVVTASRNGTRRARAGSTKERTGWGREEGRGAEKAEKAVKRGDGSG